MELQIRFFVCIFVFLSICAIHTSAEYPGTKGITCYACEYNNFSPSGPTNSKTCAKNPTQKETVHFATTLEVNRHTEAKYSVHRDSSASAGPGNGAEAKTETETAIHCFVAIGSLEGKYQIGMRGAILKPRQHPKKGKDNNTWEFLPNSTENQYTFCDDEFPMDPLPSNFIFGTTCYCLEDKCNDWILENENIDRITPEILATSTDTDEGKDDCTGITDVYIWTTTGDSKSSQLTVTWIIVIAIIVTGQLMSFVVFSKFSLL